MPIYTYIYTHKLGTLRAPRERVAWVREKECATMRRATDAAGGGGWRGGEQQEVLETVGVGEIFDSGGVLNASRQKEMSRPGEWGMRCIFL